MNTQGRLSRSLTLLATLLFVAVIASTSGIGATEPERQSSQHKVYGGLPTQQGFSLKTWTRTLENEGFWVGYSELRRNPLWVCYQARPITNRRVYRRPRDFAVDYRTWVRVNTRDYARSGYQRGHLAPSWLIAQVYGQSAQRQTFLMSNISPQTASLNQKLWQRIEEIEADRFAEWFEGIWVFAGPIFDEDIQHLRSGVEIPDAFYRILVDEGIEEPKVLAFIMPQAVRGDEPLDQFIVSVDEIEARTGLDFLSAFDDTLEDRIESMPADAGYWRLAEISRLPGRY